MTLTEFKNQFVSHEVKKETYAEFQLNRQWGVRGYPTVLMKKDSELFMVCHGFATIDQMKEVVEKIKNNVPATAI